MTTIDKRRAVFYTSAAVNYLPKVRMLCSSIKKYYPESDVVLLLPDIKPDWMDTDKEPFDRVLTIDDLDIPDAERWIYFHQIVELATAVKPFAMSHLLADSAYDAVIYFDPDMVLFSPVDDLLESLEDSNLILTPHQVTPESTLEAIKDNEICSLKHGVYNLGFVGVRDTPEGRRFAKWWSDRTYHFCIAAVAEGLFTDQRWIDLAPAFFDGVNIIKEPRHNVATWNITTRKVAGNMKTGITVDGKPLGFYHFTGFDSGDHMIMAEKNAPGNKSVRELIDWYIKSCEQATDEQAESTPWAYATYDDGRKIQKCERWIYRQRKDLQAAFPHPSRTGTHSFKAWLEGQGPSEYPELLDENGECLADAPSTCTPSSIPGGEQASWLRLALTPRTAPAVFRLARSRLKERGPMWFVRRLKP